MTINEKIKNVKNELELENKKIQQLAQMRDQAIARQNMLVGKLEAYNELLVEEGESDNDEAEENYS